MMKQLSKIAMMGLMMGTSAVWASGIPVFGNAEVTMMSVDQLKSDATREVVETQKNLMNKTMEATGIRTSAEALKKAYASALTIPSKTVSGVQDAVGEVIDGVVVKPCGGSTKEIMAKLDETIVLPVRDAENQVYLTATEETKRLEQLTKSLENTATMNLSKAWQAQTDLANIAKSADDVMKNLEKADDQLKALAQIMYIQSEMQKNMNTRVSLMADDMTVGSLSALDVND